MYRGVASHKTGKRNAACQGGFCELCAQSRRGDDSPRLRCSSRRRREPCSGRCNRAGRPTCGTILLVERWTGGARRPTTERTPGLFPAWRSLVTSSAASACARWRTAAWWRRSSSSSKITICPGSRGTVLWTVMTLKVCTASIPQHTWPAFGTPAWTARHRKALRVDKSRFQPCVCTPRLVRRTWQTMTSGATAATHD